MNENLEFSLAFSPNDVISKSKEYLILMQYMHYARGFLILNWIMTVYRFSRIISIETKNFITYYILIFVECILNRKNVNYLLVSQKFATKKMEIQLMRAIVLSACKIENILIWISKLNYYYYCKIINSTLWTVVCA